MSEQELRRHRCCFTGHRPERLGMQLMAERGWTAYRLAKESGLSESTLANIFKRNTVPSIGTLESVLKTLNLDCDFTRIAEQLDAIAATVKPPRE